MKKVDVLLLCEGTYPYISGGVSSWVHTLVSGLKELTFGVIFIGALKSMYGEIKYKIPENVIFVKTEYLFEKTELPEPKRRRIPRDRMIEIISFINWLKTKDKTQQWSLHKIYELLKYVKLEDFLYSMETWSFMTEGYFKNASNLPFIDYFWTLRNIHIPIWRVHEIADKIEDEFAILHSPSTGYAGLLGVFLKSRTHKPLLIHEHGIYVRERILDISFADWVKEPEGLNITKWQENYLKTLWTNFFLGINRLTYEYSDRIFSLFGDARRIQIELGAKEEKTWVLPNGVDINKYGECIKKRPKEIPQVVACIARVVSIKDIITFINGCKVFLEKMPNGECWIVGGTDEEPEYAEACKALVKSLGITDKVKFLGFQNVTDILPKIGISALTSISEGMPLSLLESLASGVPVVATDVGSCREIIEGGINREDRALGMAGIVVTPGDAYEIGMAFYRLLSDKELWEKCQKAGLERVRRFYSLENFFDNYRNIYRSYMDGRDRI